MGAGHSQHVCFTVGPHCKVLEQDLMAWPFLLGAPGGSKKIVRDRIPVKDESRFNGGHEYKASLKVLYGM
jgi:hypothetical protein